MVGDCDVSDECVSSLNYPSHHGNFESCSVTMLRDAILHVGPFFEVEVRCDHLIIRGEDILNKESFPDSLSAGETFTWSSDYETAKTG